MDTLKCGPSQIIQKYKTTERTHIVKKGQQTAGLPATQIPATYAGAGVSYADIDPAKVYAQKLASKTVSGVQWLGLSPQEQFRGESAYVIRLPLERGYIGHVEEGLGTKIIMADTLYELEGDPSGYTVVGQDTVGMIVNDLLTTGLLPVSLQMHLAAGSGDWLKDDVRVAALFEGWLRGTQHSGAVWSGGETPVLPGIVNAETAVIAGSAVGFLPHPHTPIEECISAGDLIVGIPSSGVMSNGISLLRKIADAQPKKERIELLRLALKPTIIYADVIKEFMARKIKPCYVIHVTGHGWRKLMRARNPFTYVVDDVLPVLDVFRKYQIAGKISKKEMWGNYNMGTGFIAIFNPRVASIAVECLNRIGHKAAKIIGRVENGPRSVVIKPMRLKFTEADMKLR